MKTAGLEELSAAAKSERYFVSGWRRTGSLWLWCAVLALLCTFITFPGIWYSDSYVRVTTAEAVLNSVVKTLTGHRAPLHTGNAFTVIPSFFMMISIGLTGHTGLYTFFQAFLFFAAVFLFIRELNPGWEKLQSVLFALSPVVYGASVYYEANVGSLTGMIFLILFLRRIPREKERCDRWIEFAGIAFFSFMTFGYRTNAMTVLPVLLLYLAKLKCRMARKALAALALCVGLGMVWLVPWVFDVHGESNGMTGFVWEMITILQRMDEPERTEYEDYLDEIGGEGATLAAIQGSHERSVDGFMWSTGLHTEALSKPGASWKVIQKYLRLMGEQPALFFQVKGDFLARALGMTAPLDMYEYAYDRWEQMAQYGMTDSAPRRGFHQSVLRANEIFGFYTCRPWVAFLISALMVVVETLRKNPRKELYALVLWTAIFSYGAYLLVIVVFQQRMFYPALFLMMAMDAAILLDWIRDAAGKAGKHIKHAKQEGDKNPSRIQNSNQNR